MKTDNQVEPLRDNLEIQVGRRYFFRHASITTGKLIVDNGVSVLISPCLGTYWEIPRSAIIAPVPPTRSARFLAWILARFFAPSTED